MGRQLDAFLGLFSRETRENVLCLRKLIFEVFRGASEQIDLKTKQITYSQGKGEGWVLALAPHMKQVNLIFSKGANLVDPKGLLSGTGKEVRHLKIKSEAQTQDPELRLLLEQAVKQQRD